MSYQIVKNHCPKIDNKNDKKFVYNEPHKKNKYICDTVLR